MVPGFRCPSVSHRRPCCFTRSRRCLARGYLWTPGYWAWNPSDSGYYWVPGTWVLPPGVGDLWTPGYWAFEDSCYLWHAG